MPNLCRRSLSDYVQLTKPRIVVMILVTTTATAMIGAGGAGGAGSRLFWLLVGTAAVAGKCGCGESDLGTRSIDRADDSDGDAAATRRAGSGDLPAIGVHGRDFGARSGSACCCIWPCSDPICRRVVGRLDLVVVRAWCTRR